MSEQAPPFDQRELRSALGRFVTGVTVITTRDAEGRLHGVTANSFTSVSLDPPLVLWCQALSSSSYAAFQGSPRFAVNILAEDQIALSNHFAKSGGDKFLTLPEELGPHEAGLGDVPLLPGVTAHLECLKVATHIAGDHAIYIGHVQGLRQAELPPLVFGRGQYLRAAPHDGSGSVARK